MYLIGIDIGGTKCVISVGNASEIKLDIIEKVKFTTNTSIPFEKFIKRFYNIIDEFLKSYNISAIGISCGGPLDSKNGIILSPPHLPNLHNVNIKELFENRYKIPCFLQNDANACALAEWLYGAGSRSENMVFLTFGTGLGAGLIINNKLYEGNNGNAGEVGHIRLSSNGPTGFGKCGSFEGFCSGSGIAQLGYTMGLSAYQQGKRPKFFNLTDPNQITAKSIAQAIDEFNDETAINVFKKCGEYLGYGLSIIIDILNPEKIVIGSIFERSRDKLWDSCKKVINSEALAVSSESCEIVPAILGENIGDYAAITVGIYGIKNQ